MKLEIHPSAAHNFNLKATLLIELVKEMPPTNGYKDDFPSERHAISISDNDIIGEFEESTTDYRGNVIARFFYKNEKRLGIDVDDYKKLLSVATALQATNQVKNVLSLKYIENILFEWIKRQSIHGISEKTFVDTLSEEAESQINSRTIYIPIANLEVEAPFQISNSEIHPLSKSLFAKWEMELNDDDNDKKITDYFDQTKKDFQGLAAVRTVIEAEQGRAIEFALEEAQKISSVLAIFSVATLLPDVKCTSKVKGTEVIDHFDAFIEHYCPEFGLVHVSSTIDLPSAKIWRLGRKEIEKIHGLALSKISTLLAASHLTQFQSSVLTALFIYSKCAFTADPLEKVVYILSALESILLKNENEPIQHSLAERLAVFSSKELSKRKHIITTIKKVYGLRSRYLHHGHSSTEMELISDFLLMAWLFFVQLVDNVDGFNEKEVFLSTIDDSKLS